MYDIIFLPRDATLEQYMLWPCMCLSVRPSVYVCRKLVFY